MFPIFFFPLWWAVIVYVLCQWMVSMVSWHTPWPGFLYAFLVGITPFLPSIVRMVVKNSPKLAVSLRREYTWKYLSVVLTVLVAYLWAKVTFMESLCFGYLVLGGWFAFSGLVSFLIAGGLLLFAAVLLFVKEGVIAEVLMLYVFYALVIWIVHEYILCIRNQWDSCKNNSQIHE